MAIFDDGSGPALYAGGTSFLERYDGTSWTSIPLLGNVEALHIHEDGSGSALFVGGSFSEVAGVPVAGLARYDGVWSNMAGGLTDNGLVRAFASYDDGSGPRLALGGVFDETGGVSTRNISIWDGTSYEALGTGVGTFGFSESGVHALQAFDDGLPGGQGLYVGGSFPDAGGISTLNWARWSRMGWEVLPGPTGYWVHDFALLEDEQGTALYVGAGNFLGRWDGTTLTNVAQGLRITPLAVEAFDDGDGERIYAGSDSSGVNATLHGTDPAFLTSWGRSDWEPVDPGDGVGAGRYDAVRALTRHDFGAGTELVAGGKFAAAGGRSMALVGRHDGESWVPVGGNLTGTVSSLAVHDDGQGARLYASGRQIGIDGAVAVVTRFDGTEWIGLGSSLAPSSAQGACLLSFREGPAQRLFLGGDFHEVDGAPVSFLARWGVLGWEQVGGGLDGEFYGEGVVDLVAFDDGNGEALYAAGEFETAGGSIVDNIARWDGLAWTPVGGGFGLSGPLQRGIFDLEVFEAPQGRVLVAAGEFQTAGGAPVQGIAMWDGSSWSALGTGLGGSAPYAYSLAAHDPDGSGQRLYVTGSFESAGGLPSEGGAVWDGVAWTSSFEVGGLVLDMQVHDDGEGRALYLGGAFHSVGGVVSSNVARLADPCGADLGLPYCTSLPNSTGQRGLLRAAGSASVAAEDLQLSVSGLPPGKPTLLFHGPQAAQAPLGDGLRCISGGLVRIQPLLTSDPLGGASLSVDFSASYASDFVAGSSVRFQAWYRDGAGGPEGSNTTDGLWVELRP